MDRLPLEGIRIADFTQVVQGPFSTLMLAQMGAEAIKIETESRNQMGQRQDLGTFTNINGSKKSITLNLKDPLGIEVAKRLVSISDVVVENFASGVMERLGLGYDDLRKVKPDVIMVSSQALGRTGPLSNAIGLFAETANFAGLSNLTGYIGGKPGMVGGIWADHLTGMHIAFAVQVALHHHRKTGEGQYIQMSMAETVIACLPEAILDYFVNGRDPGRQENQDPAMAPHNVYRCQGFDKWVAIAVTDEEEWQALCQVMEHPEWAQDPRFADPLSRWHNQVEMDGLVTQWTLQHTDYEAMHILQRAGVAAGPVLDAAGLVNDAHLNERGYFVPLGEVDGNHYVQIGHPWRMSDSPPPFYKLAPQMGEHNQYVLGELFGMREDEIANLVEAKVLV